MSLLLHRRYPCCGGSSRFPVDADLYDRTCPRCGKRWSVRRRAASAHTAVLNVVGVLEWTEQTVTAAAVAS